MRRSHEEIENKEHYVKDVSLREEESRIHIKPQILAILRSYEFNKLNVMEPKKTTFTDFLYSISFNPSILFNSFIQ